jgi:hypothetical protein
MGDAGRRRPGPMPPAEPVVVSARMRANFLYF